MAFNNSSTALQAQLPTPLYYPVVYSLRIIATTSMVLNFCVIILLIKLKKNFRNYNYWFQILVLANVDLLNGFTSFIRTFYRSSPFKDDLPACCAIIYGYMFCQINTLSTICCICVYRFRLINNINKLGFTISKYQQKIAFLLVAMVCLIYNTIPYFAWVSKHTVLISCTPLVIFGANMPQYRMFNFLSILLPLILMNILYGICLYKLKPLRRMANSLNQPSSEQIPSSSQLTEESSTDNTKPKADSISDTLKKSKANLNLSVPMPRNTGTERTPVNGCSLSIYSSQKRKPRVELSETPRLQRVRRSQIVPINKHSLPTTETPSFGIYQARKETQYKAVKFLGIILFLTNVTTLTPLSAMVRGLLLNSKASNDTIVLGLICLSLNSCVNAFVYGLYAAEIRTYLKKMFSHFRQLVVSHILQNDRG